MNTKQLLETLLGAGGETATHTKNALERTIGIPGEGSARSAHLKGLGQGAVAGGLFGLLIGSKGGRKLGKNAVKYGGFAAAATLAYKAFQSYQQKSQQPVSSQGEAFENLKEVSADKRSELLLRTMIAAAHSDGHLDEREIERIDQQVSSLNLDLSTARLINQELHHPKSIAALAAYADTSAARTEMYLLSALIVDSANPQERRYLDELATALRIPKSLADQLESMAIQPDPGLTVG